MQCYKSAYSLPVCPTRSSLATRWVLSIVTLMGFVVLDFAYIGVVINYSMQCQLLVYLLHNICDHMKTKEWEIEQSIKVGDVIITSFLELPSAVHAYAPPTSQCV